MFEFGCPNLSLLYDFYQMGNAHRRQKPSCLNSDVFFFRMRINSFEFPYCLFSVLFTWVSLSMNLYGQREREVMPPPPPPPWCGVAGETCAELDNTSVLSHPTTIRLASSESYTSVRTQELIWISF
jgi:hypothetical protein